MNMRARNASRSRGDLEVQARAAVGRALDRQCATQPPGTLVQTGQAASASAALVRRDARRIETAAVIGHVDRQTISLGPDRDDDAVRAGVTRDVIERLFQDQM